jgi:hypothetical protein
MMTATSLRSRQPARPQSASSRAMRIANFALAALCLLFSGAVQAANDLTGPIGGGGPGFGITGLVGSASAPTYTGPGDVVSGASIYVGLTAYNGAQAAAGTQKMVNLRNTATGEACDVLVASNGSLGLTANCSGSSSGEAAATFCAQSGGPCATVTGYDEANGNNITQGTTADQPPLTFSSIGSLPAWTPTGTQFLTGSLASAPAQPYTMVTVLQQASATSQKCYVNTANCAPTISHAASTNTDFINASSNANFTASDGVLHVIICVFNGASSVCNVDGTETTLSPGTSVAAGNFSLMAGTGGFGGMSGQMTLGALWPLGFSPTQRTQMCQKLQAIYGAGNFGAAC